MRGFLAIRLSLTPSAAKTFLEAGFKSKTFVIQVNLTLRQLPER
jgi:hypothetical protein